MGAISVPSGPLRQLALLPLAPLQVPLWLDSKLKAALQNKASPGWVRWVAPIGNNLQIRNCELVQGSIGILHAPPKQQQQDDTNDETTSGGVERFMVLDSSFSYMEYGVILDHGITPLLDLDHHPPAAEQQVDQVEGGSIQLDSATMSYMEHHGIVATLGNHQQAGGNLVHDITLTNTQFDVIGTSAIQIDTDTTVLEQLTMEDIQCNNIDTHGCIVVTGPMPIGTQIKDVTCHKQGGGEEQQTLAERYLPTSNDPTCIHLSWVEDMLGRSNLGLVSTDWSYTLDIQNVQVTVPDRPDDGSAIAIHVLIPQDNDHQGIAPTVDVTIANVTISV